MTQPGGYTIAPGAEWTGPAAGWPVTLVARETDAGHWLTDVVPVRPTAPRLQWHLCCVACPARPSVFCLSPDAAAESYRVTWADVLAGILSHIRVCHPDVVAS